MSANAGEKPLVIGHRGAPGYRPEHTEEAYRLAFKLGADAVEPDVVFSRDGVPVIRHENEISGTTDVAERSEFAARQTTRSVDGAPLTGWFTEDFTWAELQTLRAKERIPAVRGASAAYDGRFGVLRLSDVLRIVDEASAAAGRRLSAVVEVKHATHFEAAGFAVAELLLAEFAAAGWAARPDQLVVESFEQTVLTRLQALGLPARYVYLVEAGGTAFDLVARLGTAAPDYASQLTDAGLAVLAGEVDGISVDKALIVPRDGSGASGAVSDIVERAHRAGLSVYTWTLRAENRFLPRDLRVGTSAAAFGLWREEFALIMATGLDGVFADQPDLALEVRSGMEASGAGGGSGSSAVSGGSGVGGSA
jgi:glycerophosphoryl diester phosphodiesterase